MTFSVRYVRRHVISIFPIIGDANMVHLVISMLSATFFPFKVILLPSVI